MALHTQAASEDSPPVTIRPQFCRPGETGEVPRFAIPDLEMDPDTAFQVVLFFVSKKNGGLLPSTNYDNPTLDKLFAQSQLTTGAKRLAILHRMQDILMRDLPMIPIVEFPSSFAVRKGLAPLQGRPNNTVTYWYFK